MTLNEIEDKIANNDLSAAQVFTQMKQHISNDRDYFFSCNFKNKEGNSEYYWAQSTFDGRINADGAMNQFLDYVKTEFKATNIDVVAFNRC